MSSKYTFKMKMAELWTLKFVLKFVSMVYLEWLSSNSNKFKWWLIGLCKKKEFSMEIKCHMFVASDIRYGPK